MAADKGQQRREAKSIMDRAWIRSLLSYDSETGLFTWLQGRGSAGPDRRAGCAEKKDGYIVIKIDRRIYKAHRLAWLYVNGEWPTEEIDHVNGDPSDNRIANLREATRSQNMANRGAHTDNSSGHKGVSWNAAKRKWTVHIQKDGKNRYLGRFAEKADAVATYARAARELHGEFAKLI